MRRNERREKGKARGKGSATPSGTPHSRVQDSHTEEATNTSDAFTTTTTNTSMPSLHMQFRRWSSEPERERARGKRVIGRERESEMGAKDGEKVMEERMQLQEQLQHPRSRRSQLHRRPTSPSHSSPRGEKHGLGAMVSRDTRDSRDCYGEIRKDRRDRDRKDSMQEEARRDGENGGDTDTQERPIPCSLRA